MNRRDATQRRRGLTAKGRFGIMGGADTDVSTVPRGSRMSPMRTLRIGHSPDADDAFMFYALAQRKVVVDGYQLAHVVQDIETLNQRALHSELEATAISAAAYPQVADRYRITSSGSSFGRGYGPIVVAREGRGPRGLQGARVAIPGTLTTAYLLLRIYASGFEAVKMPFDQIGEAVLAGQTDAGLVIHEGQVTYAELGLAKILDLGELWQRETSLPLPLGIDVVRRDVGERVAESIARALRESIQYALRHEDEALAYAVQFGRGIDIEVCRKFVRMYVNEDTLDIGQEGRLALAALYEKAHARGLISAVPPLDVLD